LQIRRKEPEERRAEQHSGDHLGNDLRLAKSLGDEPNGTADPQNNRDLEKKLDSKVKVLHPTNCTNNSCSNKYQNPYFHGF
jgi:hypothetical protein